MAPGEGEPAGEVVDEQVLLLRIGRALGYMQAMLDRKPELGQVAPGHVVTETPHPQGTLAEVLQQLAREFGPMNPETMPNRGGWLHLLARCGCRLPADPGEQCRRWLHRTATVVARRQIRLGCRWPWLIGVFTGLAALALIGVLTGRQGGSPGPVGMTLALAIVTFGPLGWFVVRHLPDRLGPADGGVRLTAAVGTVAVCWSTLLVPGWLSQWLWLPPLELIRSCCCGSPTARCRPAAGAVSRRCWLAPCMVAVIALAVAAAFAPRTLVTSIDQPIPPLAQLLVRVALAAVALLVLGTLVVGAGLVSRWRHAAPPGASLPTCCQARCCWLSGWPWTSSTCPVAGSQRSSPCRWA